VNDSNFVLNAISFKGANTRAGNFGGFTETTTWGLRLSEVTGTSLTPILTVTGIPNPSGFTGSEWLTWTFTDTDQKTPLSSGTYAIEVFSSQGYFGIDAAVASSSYAADLLSIARAARAFSSNVIQDRGYDRTFVADVTGAGACERNPHARRSRFAGPSPAAIEQSDRERHAASERFGNTNW
jgi:hypothetical protein